MSTAAAPVAPGPAACSSPSGKSMAKKRWAVLRIVAKTGRVLQKRSLQQEEEELLNHLYGTNDENVNTDGGGAPLACEDRKHLKEFLDTNEHDLDDKEVEYFRKLISSPSVPSAHVARVRQSIAAQQQKLKLEKPEAQKPRPPSITTAQDAISLRREVWTSFQALQESKRSEYYQKKKDQSEKSKRAELELREKQAKKGSNFFESLFESIASIGKSPKEQKEQDDDDMTEDALNQEEDEPLVYSILGTSPDDVDCAPHVLTPPLMEQLRPHLPMSVQHDHFWLKYSATRDGASLRALIYALRYSSRTILAIETMQGHVFGAFCSSPWKTHGPRYFGTGEAFCWRLRTPRAAQSVQELLKLEQNVEIFPWSGENDNVQRLEQLDQPLIIGGGGSHHKNNSGDNHDKKGSALVLSPTLEQGHSHPCLTFQSPILPLSTTDGETFEIANVEVWTLTPMDTVDQAEKVELGRRFIFDNSDFVEA